MMANESETVLEPNCTVKLERGQRGGTGFTVRANENTTEEQVDAALKQAEYAYDKLDARFPVGGKGE